MPAPTARPRRTPWPDLPPERGGGAARVAVVVANSNTRRPLVVVDNASSDGSRELLRALARAGLLHVILNRGERYHGPAVTQGISWLARRQRTATPRDRIDYVWVLDSDTVVLRPDTARDALAVFERTGAAIVGQRGDPVDDRLLRRNSEMLHPVSLMLDPAQVWRRPIPPFEVGGEPAKALQLAADSQGLRLVAFPFVAQAHVLHVGRGTLREIVESNRTGNRHYQWAVGHWEPHFSGRKDGPEIHRAFRRVFDAEVGDLRPDSLVDACRRGGLATLDA